MTSLDASRIRERNQASLLALSAPPMTNLIRDQIEETLQDTSRTIETVAPSSEDPSTQLVKKKR